MSELKTENAEQEILTPEQMKERLEEMSAYYKEQIPFLKLQSEHAVLLADIEEARARRLEMTLRLVHMSNPPENSKKQEIPQERKLKSQG